MLDYEDEWKQIDIIHCPCRNCNGMLLSNPFRHELMCSDCKKLFIDHHDFVEVK